MQGRGSLGFHGLELCRLHDSLSSLIKQQVDEQTLHMLKSPDCVHLVLAAAPVGWMTLNLLL